MWKWIEPISCDLFEGYWNIVDEGKLLNTDEAIYAKWCNEKYNLECEGMKHKESGREHGIVRWVSPTGIICEACYKDGKQHGLCRWIKKSSVYVSLCKDDEVLAKFVGREWIYENANSIYFCLIVLIVCAIEPID